MRLDDVVACEGELGRNVGARADKMLGGRDDVEEAEEGGRGGLDGVSVVGLSTRGSLIRSSVCFPD